MVLDVGHNEQGFRAILNQLEKESYDRLHIMIGFSAEKDIGNYKSNILKMNQAKELIEELRIKDKKKNN